MKLLLQSFTKFSRIGLFDTDTFVIEERDKLNGETIETYGIYAQLGSQKIILFGKEQTPFLAIDQRLIKFTSDISIELQNKESQQHITILKNKEPLVDWLYTKPEMDVSPLFMNFCAEEEEDYDFGIFLSLLSKNQERLHCIVQTQKSTVKLYIEKKRGFRWLWSKLKKL